MRKLIAVIIASSVFGGAVGALATAATQSQASPGAIAAAVARVQDQRAEGSLSAISGKLGGLRGDVQALATTVGTVTPAVNLTAHDANLLDRALFNELVQICRNTAPSSYTPCSGIFPILP